MLSQEQMALVSAFISSAVIAAVITIAVATTVAAVKSRSAPDDIKIPGRENNFILNLK